MNSAPALTTRQVGGVSPLVASVGQLRDYLGDPGEVLSRLNRALRSTLEYSEVLSLLRPFTCLRIWRKAKSATRMRDEWVACRATEFACLFNTKEGIFFSKAAMVTFGGAYAVLPYVAQPAVQTHHWLFAGQVLDGLGLGHAGIEENNPGSLDHGDAVRRLSRRLEPSGTVAATAGRPDWRLGDNLDDIHSLLSMDLFGWPLH
jgi:hypothetical protein